MEETEMPQNSPRMVVDHLSARPISVHDEKYNRPSTDQENIHGSTFQEILWLLMKAVDVCHRLKCTEHDNKAEAGKTEDEQQPNPPPR